MYVYNVHPDVINEQRLLYPFRLIVANAYVQRGEQWIISDTSVVKCPLETTLPEQTDAPSAETPSDY